MEESPPPPPGTHQVYHMLSSQNTVPPLRDKGIDDNGGLELSDLQEELSRAKEQICMLEVGCTCMHEMFKCFKEGLGGGGL